MNNPFDYTPDEACKEAFDRLVARIEELRLSNRPEDINLCRELDGGKMLGVLIAHDCEGRSHTLYAFSGQLGDEGFYHRDFVAPVFDYLQPDGYFKTKESDISRHNNEIAAFEAGPLADIRKKFEQEKAGCDAAVADYQEQCRLSKSARQDIRESGTLSEAETAELTRQSQFEKAELRRLKKRMAESLAPYAAKLAEAQSQLDAMKARRRSESEALQQWLFSNFSLLNAKGDSRNLNEIFAETTLKVPPSGAGECCAPKLLQAAYLRGWQPTSMAEYWYGAPKGGEVRIHGQHYPACRGKCLPVLSWMLQGLQSDCRLDSMHQDDRTLSPEIIYENQWFCVVNKPGGMLSVPGKGDATSVEQWLKDKYGSDRHIKMAHRLDQDTSGLLVATFGQLPFKIMQSLFATRKVKKAYIADLEGDFRARGLAQSGRIVLPLSPDWLDRPRQRIDSECGKEAVTDYEFIGLSDGTSRIILRPLTGRTHQLRVHAASALGLGMPMVGDRLYGQKPATSSDRLHLHAYKLEFTFPLDDHHYTFESPLPF